jgi:hypothetical protein
VGDFLDQLAKIKLPLKFSAIYQEAVEGHKGELKDIIAGQEGQQKVALSWGDRNGKRLIKITKSGGSFSVSTDNFHGVDSGSPFGEKTKFVATEGQSFEEHTVGQSSTKQGRLSARQFSMIFDPTQTIEAFQNKPFSSWISEATSKRESLDSYFVAVPAGSLTFQLNSRAPQFVATVSAADPLGKELERIEVSDIKSFAEGFLPTQVVRMVHDRQGKWIGTTTYTLKSANKEVPKDEFKQSWPERSRVWDDINQRALVMQNGKLIVDERLTAAMRSEPEPPSLAFYIGGTVTIIGVGIALALAVRQVQRNRARRKG